MDLRELLKERRHPAVTVAFYLVLTVGVYEIIASAFAIVDGDEALMVFRLGLAGVIFTLPFAAVIGWIVYTGQPLTCALPPNPFAGPGPATVDPLLFDPNVNRRAYRWVTGSCLGVSAVVLIFCFWMMARAPQMAASFFS